MRDANFNLFLEVVSLVLFFIFLAFFVVFAVTAMNIVFIEVEDEEPTAVEAAMYNPRGYLLTLLVFTVPAVVVALAGLGVRVLLLRPEPAPARNNGAAIGLKKEDDQDDQTSSRALRARGRATNR